LPIACDGRAFDVGDAPADVITGLRPSGCDLGSCTRPPRFRHSRNGSRGFDRVIIRPSQPDLLAAGAAYGPASRANSGRIDGIGGCTMRANDLHGERPLPWACNSESERADA